MSDISVNFIRIDFTIKLPMRWISRIIIQWDISKRDRSFTIPKLFVSLMAI